MYGNNFYEFVTLFGMIYFTKFLLIDKSNINASMCLVETEELGSYHV